MKPILVVYAHPNPGVSRVNRQLRAAVENSEDITFHDLYEAYPDFFIDVIREQALLLEHRAIVFQHPFYWYSCPPLLKEWMDRVLEYGFAYGEGGDKLHGKHFLQAITTAGPEARYRREGLNHFTLLELLRPFEQSAHQCGLVTHAPFIVCGVKSLSEEDLQQHTARYRALLMEVVMGRYPPVTNTFGEA